MSPNAVTWKQGGWALFLDVDGTLVDIAETPQGVRVPESLKSLLVTTSMQLEGALALVSGRSLDDIDRLFDPLRLCASAGHGSERRDASGCVERPLPRVQELDGARQELAEFVRRHPGLLLEDKRYALAVHFRRAPHLSADVQAELKRVCERLGPRYALQPGKCVFELRPAEWTKGRSIEAFMQQAPFTGRVPIFVGDDVSDESGFAAVNQAGGISIRVGQEHTTLAQYRMHGVRDVLGWLARAAELPSA